MMSRISIPRRFIRIAKNCLIDSVAAAPWVPSTGNARLIESSMPPGFSFTLSTNALSAGADEAARRPYTRLLRLTSENASKSRASWRERSEFEPPVPGSKLSDDNVVLICDAETSCLERPKHQCRFGATVATFKGSLLRHAPHRD
jgi:hypothetical protein